MSGQVGAGVRAERVEGLRDVRCGLVEGGVGTRIAVEGVD